MKERPILMSAVEVQGLFDLKRTQVRRIAKCSPKPIYGGMTGNRVGTEIGQPYKERPNVLLCPWGKPGDRLWVREKWASPEIDLTKRGRVAYNADGKCGCWVDDGGGGYGFWGHGRILQADGYSKYFPSTGAETYGLAKYGGRWRSSIHMPRWASRFTLEITDVRVQRLQDISEEDASAEGISLSVIDPSPRGVAPIYPKQYGYCRDVFSDLWNTIHGESVWDKNPFVWALTFKLVQP